MIGENASFMNQSFIPLSWLWNLLRGFVIKGFVGVSLFEMNLGFGE